ncbi:MAG: hypothetical protein FWE16_00630 [Firmicutes bacterium]|nr:hypothetical protein [Bacillota bacterium]
MKLALIEMGTSNFRLILSHIKEGEYFVPYKTITEAVGIEEQINSDAMISSTRFRECSSILQMFKSIIDAEGIKDIQVIATNSLSHAKNYQSFIEDAKTQLGTDVRVMSPEGEMSALYSAVTNTLDVQKGTVVSITTQCVRIINYNRRIILESAVIPIGTFGIFKQSSDPEKAIEAFTEQLKKHATIFENMDAEGLIIGVGETFSAYSRLARKITKYSVDIEHNYHTCNETFDKVFTFIKDLDPEKRARMKGVSTQSISAVLGGLCIMTAILRFTGVKNIVVGNIYRNKGLLFQHTIPFTSERPMPDLLGYCLEMTKDFTGLDKESGTRMYELGLMLFKQLKVLHKLPRGYAKVLRVAAQLYKLGGVVNPVTHERNNYHAIMNSTLYGICHKDIVLASFCAAQKRWEDFNLSEWVRYKDIMTEFDLDAVRKISNILAIADALNIRNKDVVKDITCDILGDSVIIKLVTDTDTKSLKVDPKAAQIEIYFAKKYASEFERAFKKKLEVL